MMLIYFVLIVIFGLAIAEDGQVESESPVPCTPSLTTSHSIIHGTQIKMLLMELMMEDVYV